MLDQAGDVVEGRKGDVAVLIEPDGQFLNREEKSAGFNMISYPKRVVVLGRKSFLRRLRYGVDLYVLLVNTAVFLSRNNDTYSRHKDNVPPLGPVMKVRRRDRQSHQAAA